MQSQPIIITRPADRMDDMRKRLSDCQNPILSGPLITIGPVDRMPQPTKSADGVIVSSARALDYANNDLIHAYADRRFYIVGARANKLATDYNLTIAATAQTMDDLWPKLPTSDHLVYLCGSHSRYNHLPAEYQIVYQSRAIDTCPKELIKQGGHPAILPVYSPRTAEILVRMMEKHELSGKEWQLICISDGTARPLTQNTFKSIDLADQPTGDAMIRAITHICSN